MGENSIKVSRTRVPAGLGAAAVGGGGASPTLRRLETNPQGHCGPQTWKAFCETVPHLYVLSLPDPSEEARFTVSTRAYATPRGFLIHSRGTAFIMTREPALVARGVDQLLIYLHLEGTVETDLGDRRVRIEAGDVAIYDYARPFRSATSDYANLMIVLARDSVPAALLALEPHGLVFHRDSGPARLIGAALRELIAQADHLTMSEAEAAIEGILALTAGCARISIAGDELHHLKSRRKAALEYIDAHLANPQLGPDEIATVANLSRASLYRLLAEEGGIRAVMLKRRLDEAMRLMLEDDKDEHSLKTIVRRCGFGGMPVQPGVPRALRGAAAAVPRALAPTRH